MRPIKKINVSEISAINPFDSQDPSALAPGTLTLYKESWSDTAKWHLRLHDGVTHGGSPVGFDVEGRINKSTGLVVDTARGTLAIGTDMETPGVPQHFHIGFENSNTNAPYNDLFLGDDFNAVQIHGTDGAPYYGVRIRANDRNGGAQREWQFNADGNLNVPGNINGNGMTLGVWQENFVGMLAAPNNVDIGDIGPNASFLRINLGEITNNQTGIKGDVELLTNINEAPLAPASIYISPQLAYRWKFSGADGTLNLPASANENAVIQSPYSVEIISNAHSLMLDTSGNLTLDGNPVGGGGYQLTRGDFIAEIDSNGYFRPPYNAYIGELQTSVIYSNIANTIRSVDKDWTFGSGGKLSLGGDKGAIYANQTSGAVTIADYLGPNGEPAMPSSRIIVGGDDAFVISRGNGTNNPSWTFGNNGSLTLPNPGKIKSTGNIVLDAGEHQWNFNADGTTEFPWGTTAFVAGNGSGGQGGNIQLKFGYNGTTDWPHWIQTRHNNLHSNGNAFDFFTNNGSQYGTYPTNAVLGLTVEAGGIKVGTAGIDRKSTRLNSSHT